MCTLFFLGFRSVSNAGVDDCAAAGAVGRLRPANGGVLSARSGAGQLLQEIGRNTNVQSEYRVFGIASWQRVVMHTRRKLTRVQFYIISEIENVRCYQLLVHLLLTCCSCSCSRMVCMSDDECECVYITYVCAHFQSTRIDSRCVFCCL